MSFDDKKNRLSALSKIPHVAGTDHRLQLDADGNYPWSKLPRNKRRKLAADAKKLTNKYNTIIKKIEKSGAGFPVDNLLRELSIEYTNRYANSGIYNQPVSFNYFEPFCDILLIDKAVAPYAKPIPEIDHLFNLADFFDYITSNDVDSFNLESLKELPIDKALHFTTNGDILDFSLLNAEGRDFVISGFSMVRRRNSLHWYLLGGEVISDEEWKLRSTDQFEIELKNVTPHKRAFFEDVMRHNSNKAGAPVALEGTKRAVRTVISGEIDLTTKKYLSKCLMTETENSFNVICDDPDIFCSIPDTKERHKMIDIMKEQMSHAAVMWDVVGAMFQLPSYFAFKVNVKKEIVVAAGRQVLHKKSTGGRGVGAQYVNVSAIDIIDSKLPIVRPVVPPHFNVETSGHWRRLPLGSIGKGPDGSEELGRTWVKQKSKWRELNHEPRTIFLKSTIKAAKLKVKEYEDAAQASSATTEFNNLDSNQGFGELYVLRCTVMASEIYKVGWTSGDAEARARQLSSATGVPTSFVVVESWKHEDAEALEKSVHAMLEPYRINDRREFFQASYHSIKSIVEAEIQRSISIT